VNEVEVDVVEAKVGERSAARKLHVLSCHVRAPQFARHPQVLARAHAFGHCRADPFAHLLFVAVITCAVNVAVPVPHTGKALVLTGLCARTIGALMDHHGHWAPFTEIQMCTSAPRPLTEGRS
jgi:predicted naringenin-chalcone synthase